MPEVNYRSVIVLACVLLFGCDPKTPVQDTVVPATIGSLPGTDRMAYWTMAVCSLDLPDIPNHPGCTLANETRPIKFPPNP